MTTGAVEDRVEMPGAIPEGSGRKPREYGSGAANVTGRKATLWPEAATGLMEKIVSRGNMMAAYSRVVSNNSYDAKGNLLQITDPAGAKTVFTYNTKGKVLTVTDPLLKKITLAYQIHPQSGNRRSSRL